MKNEALKAKVTEKLIAWGGNENEVHKMVKAHFQNALDYGFSGVAKIAEYISTDL